MNTTTLPDTENAVATITGNELLTRALKAQGVDTVFFIMGGPNLDAARIMVNEGLRMIDVRHEQAAAMMAQAYARLRTRPGVCMAASGPGTMNLVTGMANAFVDGAPVVALGGASAVGEYQLGSFQEIDQVAIMRPMTKWAERVYETRRIPEYVEMAFSQAMAGKPGPVYLDLPGDVLNARIPLSAVKWPRIAGKEPARAAAAAETLAAAVQAIREASQPVVITGTGILWSKASGALQAFIEHAGMPFYTTPQGRGVLPDDHAYMYPHARSPAMSQADLVIVVGTRLNYVYQYGRPPRFNPDARFIRIDIDPGETSRGSNIDVGILGDARTVLEQLRAALANDDLPSRYAPWRARLEAIQVEKQKAQEPKLDNPQTPIHPLRLCKEVRDFLDRDAVLVVDGQEILNYGRQSLQTFVPGHRLNSGPFGTMGVGLPFGVGAKVAKPDSQVVVVHGDGSFGLNAMELDTAVRHKLPIMVVISLNGGWTADPNRDKAGRELGYTRYDRMAEALGCHGEYVEEPDEIRPALERAKKAVAEGKVAVVNVLTDYKARASQYGFTTHLT